MIFNNLGFKTNKIVYEKAIIKTDKGNMTVEFYHDDAPNTVANFIKLAESGFTMD